MTLFDWILIALVVLLWWESWRDARREEVGRRAAMDRVISNLLKGGR